MKHETCKNATQEALRSSDKIKCTETDCEYCNPIRKALIIEKLFHDASDVFESITNHTDTGGALGWFVPHTKLQEMKHTLELAHIAGIYQHES